MANRELTVISAAGYFHSNGVLELSQLDTATQATEIIKLTDKAAKQIVKGALFAITVAGIVTNVVIRLQGSLDKTNWFHLDATSVDTTITADGTYSLIYDGVGDISYIRMYFVSESGGTASTLDTKVKFF